MSQAAAAVAACGLTEESIPVRVDREDTTIVGMGEDKPIFLYRQTFI